MASHCCRMFGGPDGLGGGPSSRPGGSNGAGAVTGGAGAGGFGAGGITGGIAVGVIDGGFIAPRVVGLTAGATDGALTVGGLKPAIARCCCAAWLPCCALAAPYTPALKLPGMTGFGTRPIWGIPGMLGMPPVMLGRPGNGGRGGGPGLLRGCQGQRGSHVAGL